MVKGRGLGRCLVKKSSRPVGGATNKHTTTTNEDFSRLPIRSITEETSLTEFFSIAELANSDFTAQKKTFRFLSKNDISGVPSLVSRQQSHVTRVDQQKLLKIPRRRFPERLRVMIFGESILVYSVEWIVRYLPDAPDATESSRTGTTSTLRPQWSRTMDKDQLNLLEKEEMLTWRRSLAKLEETEGVLLTPFEKNLEFWRQLWRVVERSDILVQIVDARQPLLYYCADLDAYACETNPNKVCVVLVNKSDFLTPEQRTAWAKYFKSVGIRAIFWSATFANSYNATGKPHDLNDPLKSRDDVEDPEPLTVEAEVDESDGDTTDGYSSATIDADFSGDDLKPEEDLNGLEDSNSASLSSLDYQKSLDVADNSLSSVHKVAELTETGTSLRSSSQTETPSVDLLDAAGLLDLFSHNIYPADRPRLRGSQLTVGFVGYPNVGKSSTLNALIGSKKTAVSATPGRTKHFQTFVVRPDLVLCDCPGLVMPSFVHSKADLVVAGILQIDELRDCLSPIGLICNQIPRSVLEFKYGIDLSNPNEPDESVPDPNVPPTPYQLLAAHAFSHSFMTAKGNPHYDRSARLILKDYVQGRLLYCHPPPGMDASTFQYLGRDPNGLPPSLSHSHIVKPHSFGARRNKPGSSDGNDPAKSAVITDFDRAAFHSSRSQNSHTRSRKQIVLSSRPDANSNPGDTGDDAASTFSSSSWSTVSSSVGGCSLLSGLDSLSVSTQDQKKPWRLMCHSKRAGAVESTKPGQSRKKREKLRRVYRHLDVHEKS